MKGRRKRRKWAKEIDEVLWEVELKEAVKEFLGRKEAGTEKENPLLVDHELKAPRKIECPGCGSVLEELVNVYHDGNPLGTPTDFYCLKCRTWICGCCGAWYKDRERKGRVQLPPSPEFEELRKLMHEFYLAWWEHVRGKMCKDELLQKAVEIKKRLQKG